MINKESIIEEVKKKINNTESSDELIELAAMLKGMQREAIKKVDKYIEQDKREVICLVGTWNGIRGVIESIDGETIVVRLGAGLKITTSKEHFRYNFTLV